MTAHKHAQMIKAKADNMDLVVFRKHHNGDWIEVADQSEIRIKQSGEYFLCLPKHKEACLHWLNGGDVECNSKFTNGWEDCHDINNITWSRSIGLMRQDAKYRIKPRKEKRHIYISKLGATTYAKKTKEEAAREVSIMGGSFEVWKHYEIEIEVEV